MSLTRCVPPVVPSDTQSSVPCTPSVALKRSLSPMLANCCGTDEELPGLISRTRLGAELDASLATAEEAVARGGGRGGQAPQCSEPASNVGDGRPGRWSPLVRRLPDTRRS